MTRQLAQPPALDTYGWLRVLHSCARILTFATIGWMISCDADAATGAPQSTAIPTGKSITPTAARGAIFQDLNPHHPGAPDVRANGAAALAVSPDGRRLAILTSGYNRNFGPDAKTNSPDKFYVPELSTEYVFLFDITGPQPEQLQVLTVPNTFQGLSWAPSSDRLFASGGLDDTVVEFIRTDNMFAAGRTFKLGHRKGVGLETAHPETGALAVSPDGKTLLVANLQNDSVSLLDLASGQIIAEQDLRPGKIDPKHQGEPGGSFPRSVVWTSTAHAYVASERDREILSLSISGPFIRVTKRIPLDGQPVALLANSEGTRVYVTLDTTNQVLVFDSASDTLIEAIDATAPQSLYGNRKKLGGANSNALALTPDERTLLVSNGGENAIAVIRLGSRAIDASSATVKDADHSDDDGDGDDDHAGPASSAVIGLVPTGWYPTGVATSKDGTRWYIVNGKNPTGPNVSWCDKLDPSTQTCRADNVESLPPGARKNGFAMLLSHGQSIYQLEKSGFLTLPAPSDQELIRLTKQVARNDHFDRPRQSATDKRLFAFLRAHIHHVIYIIKENRSYDQVLGDLEVGNGDPRLTLFPRRLSPNHHAIARQFVTLDNFLVSGEVSWSGWDWAVAAQTNDFRERDEPVTDAHRGLEADSGLNRNINVGLATSEERHAERKLYPADPDILPGEHDITAPDGPGAEPGKGYLWDAALRAHRTLRNWGFFGENRNYPPTEPLLRDPYSQKKQVYFATKSTLRPYSDPYFLDFTPAFPDFWRMQEWKREFALFSAKQSAPSLMLVRLGNDHFGAFSSAIDGVNTPETQMADNDYALGLLVETVANSPFARDTLIIAVEDDACDGPDHVDAHRSIALFSGPYVRRNALVSTRYTTVSIVKTIEEILGLEPIGLNDALEVPMSDLFDTTVTNWSYEAIVPDVLRTTQLPLPPALHACDSLPRHSSDYWTLAMVGQDFSQADHIDPVTFNQALWHGLKGDTPYPAGTTGDDLSVDRSKLLNSISALRGDGCED
jgi:DNA-binding beta-propeller fold protein YncE